MTLNVIPRVNVIPGAQNDPFHVDLEFHCEMQPVHQVRVFTRSQIQGLFPTNVEIVPVAVDRRIVVLGVYYDKASGAYTDGGDITILYEDPTGTLIATIPVANMRAGGQREGWATLAPLSGTPDTVAIPDSGVQVHAPADFTGNGGNLTLTVRYLDIEA